MKHDTELETWRRQWQRDEVIPGDLRERVERETRNLRRARYVEIAVTAIMGGGAAGWALVSPRPIVVALAIGVWFFIGVAWVMSIGLRREILRPSAVTTAAFLDLSIHRCRGRLHALSVQGVLYVMILTFNLVWIYHFQSETSPMEPWPFLTSGARLVVWALTGVLAAGAGWYRRQLQAEMRNLLNLRSELGDSEREPLY